MGGWAISVVSHPETSEYRVSASWRWLWLAIGLGFILLDAGAQESVPPEAIASELEGESLSEKTPAKRRVTVVSDGSSWYFDKITRLFEEELRKYVPQIEIVKLNAGYRPGEVARLLEEALSDSETEVIYASGVAATERAKKLTASERTKPIFAGAIQFADGQDLIAEDGTSKRPNLTFITEPHRVRADLDLLKRLSGASRIRVVVDERVFAVLDLVERARAQFSEELGLTLSLHPIGSDPGEALRRIPSGPNEAVYVGLLPQMEEDARKRLYKGLADRGAIVVAMFGHQEVPLGALAGLASDLEEVVARQTALNVYQMLEGVSTSTLPTFLPVQDQLIINAETDQLLTDWSPNYELVLEANFINEEKILGGGEEMTIDRALAQAASHNIDVLIALEEERLRFQETRITASSLWPQASLNGAANRSEFSDKIDRFVADSSYGGSLGVQLRQVLFNDELLTAVRARRKSALAAAFDLQSRRLDAMEAAATAYFNVLSAKALYRIEKENLRLSQNNVQLAKLRTEIGAADASEVYRWDQDEARAKANVFKREADRRNAVVEFNRVLGLDDRDRQWNFEEIWLQDKNDYYFMNAQLKAIENEDGFRRLREFVRVAAMQNSPELASFEALLASQDEIVRQKRRRYYLPEVAATAGADRVGRGNDLVDSDAENQISLGLQLSFPLFEGGRRKAEILRERAAYRQLAAQQTKAIQQIDQRVMSAYHDLGASHPDTILSARALNSARLHHKAVLEKYAQGAATMLDLLDAQGALITQERQRAIANFTYLSDVYRLQRAIAWFQVNKTQEEYDVFAHAMEHFLKTDLDAGAREKPADPAALPASDADVKAPEETNQAIHEEATNETKKKRRFRSFFRRHRP